MHRRTRQSVAIAASASDHSRWFLVRRALVQSPRVRPMHPRDPLPQRHPELAPRQHVVKIVALPAGAVAVVVVAAVKNVVDAVARRASAE